MNPASRLTSSLLAATVSAVTLLSACAGPTVAVEPAPGAGIKPPTVSQTSGSAGEAPQGSGKPDGIAKPADEPKAEPNKPAEPAPQPPSEKPPADKPKPAPASTDAERKAVSWYYMKKKKGTVPDFPAETKKLQPDQKAVWVGAGKKVYLTIDVGGELLDADKLLKALKDNGVKATFFVTGYNLKNHPDYIKRLLAEGHVVGNHTITHRDFTTLTDDQVKQEFAEFEKLYKSITGKEPAKLFRFSYGKYSLHLLRLVTDLGYTSYFWSTAMKDWEPRKNGADDAFNDIIGNLHDGNIILMHQASQENIDAMDRILKEIKKEGYEFGLVGELQPK
jgi:peptidoglycan-N-acetylmuramic acid deacetylase